MAATFQISTHSQNAICTYKPNIFVYAKTQPTATSASYNIPKYVPQTNMPIKWNIYATYIKYLTGIYGGGMWLYVPQMKYVH